MGYKIHLADYDIKLKTQRQKQQIHISGTTFSITAYLHSTPSPAIHSSKRLIPQFR